VIDGIITDAGVADWNASETGGSFRNTTCLLIPNNGFPSGEPPATDLDVLGGAVLADGVYVG
jgi:hypothetical protein